MYILERMKVKYDNRHGKWNELETLDPRISTLLTTYSDAYFYISYPGPNDSHLKGLRLSNIRDLLSRIDQEQTIQQWLDSIGNLTLPFETELLKEISSYVKYANAWHSGYKVEPIGRNAHIESNLPNSLKEDLILTHSKLDLTNFTKKALVTVNGLFHMLDSYPNGVRILGGGSNVYKSNNNGIGIYSFETVGNIECHLIKEEWLSRIRPDAPYYDGVYMKIPETINLKDKSVLLVVGGYLNVLDSSFHLVGDNIFRINFAKMLILERIFQSRLELGLDDIGLFDDLASPTTTTIDKLMSDNVMLDYLLKTNSFIVIVDSPSFFQETKPLESLRLPGRFADLNYDRIPVMGSYGRMLEYHVIKEHSLQNDYHSKDQMYVYCTDVNVRHNYDNNSRPWRFDQAINAGRYPYRPFKHDTAYFRYLGAEF